MKIHPVVNISILKSHYDNKLSQTTIPHIDEDITEYEVERIMEERKEDREFQVKWKRYNEKTWKLFEYLKNAKDIIILWKKRMNASIIDGNDHWLGEEYGESTTKQEQDENETEATGDQEPSHLELTARESYTRLRRKQGGG